VPIINYNGIHVECKKNENLRKVLIKNQLTPYNGFSEFVNCRGLGTCGTSAVHIIGEVSSKTKIEIVRLNFPPHKENQNLRLACQCKVLGDLTIKKYLGFWGQKIF
jgi:ferredoxin